MATAAHEATGTGLQIKSDPRAMQMKNVMTSESFQRSLKAALPRHLSADKIIRLVLGAFQQTPKLLECSPESVLSSVMQSAALGLEPSGGVLGQGYLVPFWSGKNRRFECQFIPGYRGLCKLARQSGEVLQVWAEVVYQQDDFDYSLGLDPDIRHKRNDTTASPGPLVFAYAVARFRDDSKQFVVMNAREVMAIKASTSSKTKDGKIVGPWADHEAEMWKKTAIRRLAKQLPMSVEAQSMMNVTEEPGEKHILSAAFDALPAPSDDPEETQGESQGAIEVESQSENKPEKSEEQETTEVEVRPFAGG